MIEKESQGARLAAIIIELTLYGIVDKKKLTQQFSVTERTIYRDLNLLSPILEHCGDGKYAMITAPDKQVNSDLLVFLDAEKYLPQQDARFWKALPQRIQDKYICIDTDAVEHSVKDYLNKHFPILEMAIKENKACKILYKNKYRTVNPYKLTNRNAIWYLNATENNKIKSFSLGLIEWLEITPMIFDRDPEIDSVITHSRDAWVSQEKITVSLTVASDVAWYFKRRDLLPAQQIVEETQNGLKIICKAVSEKQILPLIQYWLPHITIDAPKWLDARLSKNIAHYMTNKHK